MGTKTITPDEVVKADLGYEYLKAKWAAEDDRAPIERRRIGRAMMAAILHVARRKVEKA